MRLLNTYTGAFEWHHDPSTVRYAILSHVWDVAGEQSYKDVLRITKQLQRAPPDGLPPPTLLSQVSPKIRDCCAYARQNGYTLLWIDSCCIDKSSSAELSEAINSMYQWYAQSTVCYAFLFDVPSAEDPRAAASSFRRSKWFTRGWTLQELLAPLRVVFLAGDWRPLGTLSSLVAAVADVTGIERGVLLHQTPLRTVSVARRMAWAARRVTTRVEDEAYSLMGLFDVMMPTIYGEGRGAFARLQEAILRQAPDQTLFAWGRALRPEAHPDGIRPAVHYFTLDNVLPRERNLFASAPSDFAGCAEMEPEPHLQLAERLGGLEVPFPEYTSTGFGIRTRMPVLSPKEGARHSIYIGVLACVGGDGNLTGLFLHANRAWMSNGYYIGMDKDDDGIVYRTVSLTDEVFAQWGPPEIVEVYLPTRVMTSSPWIEAPPESLSDAFATYDILLPEWRIRELEAQGYTVERFVEPAALSAKPRPPTYRFILSRLEWSSVITIEFSSCVCLPGTEEDSYRMRATVTSQTGQAHPANTTIGQSTAMPIEEDSPRLGVTHDIAHPEHVNNSSWLLDDESCTAVSKDFLCCAEDGQVTEAIRLTLSPSPEQWASYGTPQTWSSVYTLDIGIIDPKDVVDMLDS